MAYTKHGMSRGSEYICLNCEKRQIRKRHLQKYCSCKCQMQYEYKTGIRDKFKTTQKAHEVNKKRGLEKFNKNPTTHISKRGYLVIYIPQKGYKKYHHYLWEKIKGKIPKGKIIHHKNFDRLDNKIENLEMMDSKEHAKLHYAKRIIDQYGRFT